MITLVVGGTRSGKSRVAERLAAEAGLPVTYVATAEVDPHDHEHRARIAAHVARRPETWATVACGGELAGALEAIPVGTVLVDSLGSWVAAHGDRPPDLDRLVAALIARQGTTIVVTEEVGLSVHPPTASARRFVDRVGTAAQAVGAVADRVLLVVAGRVLPLEAP